VLAAAQNVEVVAVIKMIAHAKDLRAMPVICQRAVVVGYSHTDICV
jgi:hypothetical protein